jgi:hypothetical protein
MLNKIQHFWATLWPSCQKHDDYLVRPVQHTPAKHRTYSFFRPISPLSHLIFAGVIVTERHTSPLKQHARGEFTRQDR